MFREVDMKAIVVMLVFGLVMSSGARAGDFTSGDWTWNVDDPDVRTLRGLRTRPARG